MMRFNILKILLLTGVLLGTILCSGQTDTGKVCLTYPEFDFYAENLIRAEGLAKDTAILNAVSRAQASVQFHIERELVESKEATNICSWQVQDQSKTIQVLTGKLGRSDRWKRLFRNTVIVLVIYIVTETIYRTLRPQ